MTITYLSSSSHDEQQKLGIKGTAIDSNFTIITSLNSNPTHLGHGVDKRSIKLRPIGGEAADCRLGFGLREQNLVGSEEALAGDKVLVVNVVEGPRGYRIHVYGYAGIHVPRTRIH